MLTLILVICAGAVALGGAVLLVGGAWLLIRGAGRRPHRRVAVTMLGALSLVLGVAALFEATSTSANHNPARLHVVVYEVTSDAPTISSIAYVSPDKRRQVIRTDARAPWHEAVLDSKTVPKDTRLVVVARSVESATRVTCAIRIDGKVAATTTSLGPGAVVTCSTSGPSTSPAA
jgi:hypothetical protein